MNGKMVRHKAVRLSLFLSLLLVAPLSVVAAGDVRQGVVGQARTVLQDNGYTGVLVAIDPDMDVLEGDRQQLIDDLQTLLSSCSSALYTASKQRAYLKEVTIVVPKSWTVGQTVPLEEGDQYSLSLLRVVSEGVGSGAPYTIQSGPCGTPGLAMTIPKGFVAPGASSQYGDPGRVVAHEWLRLRYGVFEEHGIPGDPLYPQSFVDPVRNTSVATACSTAGELQYSWVDRSGEECQPDPANSECRLSTDNVGTTSTTSIMFSTTLDTVKEVCTAATHDPLPPTRHNRLCAGRSVEEVMLQHPDFVGGANPPGAVDQPTDPTFSLVQAVARPLFLLLDETIRNEPPNYGQGIYAVLKNSLSSVLEVVPSIGAVKFDASNVIFFHNSSLVPASEDILKELLDFLPSSVSTSGLPDPSRALAEVAPLLADQGDVDILLIQITRTSSSAPDISLYTNLHISSTLYASTTNNVNNWIENLVEQTGGVFQLDSSYSPVTASTMMQGLVEDTTTLFLKDERASISEGGQQISTVMLDATLGDDLFFSTFILDPVVSEINDLKMEVTPPAGDPFTSDVISNGEVAIYQLSNAMEGQWSVVLTSTSGLPSTSLTVSTRLRPAAEKVLISSWTSLDHLTGPVDITITPLAVFTSVLVGGHTPVTGLVVMGQLMQDQASVGEAFDLLDNGRGDPDTQKNDGVHSAYVTSFQGNTDSLSVSFTISSSSSAKSFMSQPQKAILLNYRTSPRLLPSDPFSPDPCCGSSVPDGVPQTIPFLGRVVTTPGTVSVTNTVRYNPPPSRISDFRLSSVDQNGPVEQGSDTILVSLDWTAPGSDLTNGQASSYYLRYSDDRTLLTDDFSACPLITDADLSAGSLVPLESGNLQQVTAKVPKKEQQETVYYFAIKAADNEEQMSDLSPIEMTSVTEGRVVTTTTSTTTTTTATTTTTTTTTTAPPTTTAETTLTTMDSSSADPSTTTTESTAATETTTTDQLTSTAKSTTTDETTATTESTAASETTTTDQLTSTAEPTTTDEPTATTESTVATETTTTDQLTSTAEPTTTDVTAAPTESSGSTDSFASTAPTTAPEPNEFVGSAGFWVIIVIAILVVLVGAGYCYRRQKAKSRAKKQAIAKDAAPQTTIPASSTIPAKDQPKIIVTTEEAPKAVKKFPAGHLDDAARRPSLRANRMPPITEVQQQQQDDGDSSSSSGSEDGAIIIAAVAAKGAADATNIRDAQERKASRASSISTLSGSSRKDSPEVVEVTEL